MATITVKKIPEELYQRLKESATVHRRSINGEIIYCLEQVLRSRRLNPDEYLLHVDALRKEVNLPSITEELLRKTKKVGRP
jgi:plasmid stability protein